MSAAFQANAFQNNAFQTTVGAIIPRAIIGIEELKAALANIGLEENIGGASPVFEARVSILIISSA